MEKGGIESMEKIKLRELILKNKTRSPIAEMLKEYYIVIHNHETDELRAVGIGEKKIMIKTMIGNLRQIAYYAQDEYLGIEIACRDKNVQKMLRIFFNGILKRNDRTNLIGVDEFE